MTNLQLLLTIGIPSLLVTLSLLSSNSRFDRIEKKMDGFVKRFDDLMVAGHRDALEIMRQMTALHERVAVVEAKQAE